MNCNALISIITPNYNCEEYIGRTIESVLSQTYQNWEMLIQDDCSTDKSIEIAMSYAKKDSRIKIKINTQRSGAAITRNNAIERSKGEYLAYLDSDDIWLPTKIEKQLDFMIKNNCDFSFACYEHISEEGKSLLKQAQVIKHLTYNKMLMHCWPGCLTVMYKQNLNHKIYAEDIKKNNDHALFLRVLKYCKNAMGMDECLALYRIRKGSISRNKWKVLKTFIMVVHQFEQKSLLFAHWCVFTHMFVKAFFKYKKIQSKESILHILK
ncbi:glycosyltransferase family 2 protein [Bacteroides sp.]|uniref:glycosyltransferase family 2 protein n=1 Tax=Bacteroides sp. TaxID=29523 RepID=UPI002635AC1D|nr:glycosyltransferase family 2 protein [Bacteroides sp.]MDD3038171.1 glycosyltransferase family 2 protein [Bacteroides sp.]